MIHKDDMELVKELGLSRELTEVSYVEARIYNDDKYNWAIHIHPPVERNDIIYFKIYNNNIPGTIAQFNSTKCARISMLSPDYVRCNDCSKHQWILDKKEKEYLCSIVNKFWKSLLLDYENELESFDGRKINIENIPIPNYLLLPEV